MQDGLSPSPTFLSPFLHAVSVFFLGNKSLVLQSRQCSELNILIRPTASPPFCLLLSLLIGYISRPLGPCVFCLKEAIPARGDCEGWEAVIWNFRWGGTRGCNLEFHARPAFLPLRSHSQLQLWWWRLPWASFPTTLPPSVFQSWVYCLSFKNDLLSPVTVLEGA